MLSVPVSQPVLCRFAALPRLAAPSSIKAYAVACTGCLRGMALGPLVRLFDGRPLTRLALVSEVCAASGVGSCPLVLLRAQLLDWSCDLLWQDGLGCRGAAKLLGEAWADIVDGRPLTRLALVSEVRAVAGVDPARYSGHSFWIGCGNHQDTWPLAHSVRLAPTGSLRSHHRTTGIRLLTAIHHRFYAVSYIICEKATSQNQMS